MQRKGAEGKGMEKKGRKANDDNKTSENCLNKSHLCANLIDILR